MSGLLTFNNYYLQSRQLTSSRHFGSAVIAVGDRPSRVSVTGGCGNGGSGIGLLLIGGSSTKTYSSSNDACSGRTTIGGTGGIGLVASRCDVACKQGNN